MNRKIDFNLQTELNRILEIINKIVQLSADGDYIYRGEPECYKEVSSTLYRELKKVKVKYTDIVSVQTEIVDAAKAYTGESDGIEILTVLQHYGGKTNLIDFTTDYYVALFFACYGQPDKSGRVVILKKDEIVKGMLRLPGDQEHRAKDQKGVFIEPTKGYIEQKYDIVCIPNDLKLFMLDHLREAHDIRPETIYNDLHGFISSQNAYWMAYREFFNGRSEKDKGDEAKIPKEKQKAYREAIIHYTNALDSDLQQAAIYNNRGNTYVAISETKKGIDDFSKAIELHPDYASAYVNRGKVYLSEGEINKAINDFNIAIELQPGLAEAYNNRGLAFVHSGKDDKGINDFNTAIELQPEFAAAYNNRGNAYDNKNDFVRSINDFDRAIELKSDFVDAYVNRGVAYSKRDKFDEAINNFTTAININQYHAGAYFNLGNVYLLTGEFKKAIAKYDKSLKLETEDGISYCHRGIAQLNLREWDRAKTDLTVAKEKGFDIIGAFHNLYRDIFTFERRNDLKVPKDITAILKEYTVNPFTTTQRIVTHDGETRESAAVLELLEKFRNAGKPLCEYLPQPSSRGITTGYNEAFIIHSEKRDALITEHPSSADILKPFLMARDIKRWRVKPTDEWRRERQDKWLIWTHRGIDINAYPAIKKHLEKSRDALEKRSGKQEWYELQTVPKGTDTCEQPKFIYPDLASATAFAYDDEGYYVGSPASLLPTSELWILGVLNTRAVSWFYARTAPQIRGQFLKFTSQYVSQIPIPDMEPEQRALIHKIVEYILYLKKQPTTDSKDLAHARDFVMVGYFGNILNGLTYELFLPDELHRGDKYFFQPLFDEKLPILEKIQEQEMDEMHTFRDIFERLYDRHHPIARNLFFMSSVKPIRIIEGRT